MDTSLFNITSNFHNGFFGIRGHTAPIISTKIEVVDSENKKYKPVLILAVDVSASMENQKNIEKVKDCLLHLFKTLKLKYVPEGNLGDVIDLHIITFSASAKLIWSSLFFSDESFVDVISNIKTESSTDVYSALVLARQLMLKKTPTWFVLLTDGYANIQPPSHLGKFAYGNYFLTLPKYVDAIGVGVGDHYDDTILLNANSILHANTAEELNKVLAYLHIDMFNLVGYDAQLIFPEWCSSARSHLAGGFNLRFLTLGRVIRDIYLPFGDPSKKKEGDEEKKEIVIPDNLEEIILSYVDPTGDSNIVAIAIRNVGGDLGSDEIEFYYDTSAARHIKAIATKDLGASEITTIYERMALWDQDLSQKYRTKVSEMIQNKLDGKLRKQEVLAFAQTRIQQRTYDTEDTSYSIPGYVKRYEDYAKTP